LKIAVISHLKYPIGQPYLGGLEMHTHLLTRLLLRRGHDVTLFASAGSDPQLGTVAVCPPTGEATGDPVGDAAIDAAESAAYASIVEAISGGGYDLVHNNSLHSLPLYWRDRLDAPVVTVLHTPPFDPLTEGVREAAPDMEVLAVSRTLAAEWREIVPNLSVVGNGIELGAFPFSPTPDRDAYVFWSGRIVPEKGLHLAIEAARRAGVRLLFAGPRRMGRYWSEEIAPRLGSDTIDLGHLSQPELAAAIGGARAVLVTPRWEEPFGLVVAEAIACGTPVAGFRRGALADILGPDAGRLARADDVDGLARVLMEAMTLDRFACRARAEATVDVETMIDRYEEVYRSLVVPALPAARPRELMLDGVGK
jgi:glycosyltransferase involved in cell wall biosynthesis